MTSDPPDIRPSEPAAEPRTFRTGDELRPATRPTLYFIGVTTGQSSIQRVFPRWAQELSIDAELVVIDPPLHAEPQAYRRVVQFIAADELSRGALVTTHKLDLFESCRDLFDRVDPLGPPHAGDQLPVQARGRPRVPRQGPRVRRARAGRLPDARTLP